MIVYVHADPLFFIWQCCSPQLNGGGGWGVLNAIFGWNNSATYGSVISYNVYWIVVISGFVTLRYHEKSGHYPFLNNVSHDSAEANSPADNEGLKSETITTDAKRITTAAS